MEEYDLCIVGTGLAGAVVAYRARQMGKRVLLLERRNHIGGNAACTQLAGIAVHQYGAHIFHTDNEAVWKLVNSLVEFNRYTNAPLASYQGKLYNLPFNMNTFAQMWGVQTPAEARLKLQEQRNAALIALQGRAPQNVEEQALVLVGQDIYERLVKGYTQKQWGRSCQELPAFLIRRLPLRFVFDNNYFNDRFQGIPVGGYNALFEKLLAGCEVRLNTDYLLKKDYYNRLAKQVLYTGSIDAYFDYRFGALQYRTVRFETEVLDTPNYQGNAVINYTDAAVPYTRIIEHKHFACFGNAVEQNPQTVISREYPMEWQQGTEPYYPINDERNNALYQRYKHLAAQEGKVRFGGRLAEYQYYDMDDTIEKALQFPLL